MSAHTRPDASFPVRRMDFSFAETPRYWWSGDPFMTLFMNNLSSMFPDGEQFFVDSVRDVRNQVADPQLRRDISAFVGQEVMHSREHAAYNDHSSTQGLDLQDLQHRVKRLLGLTWRLGSRRRRLAVTCALEHFTAIMAEGLLRREDLARQIEDPQLYRLWMWHAIEENEHKAIAFDTYRAVGGGYLMRVAIMLSTSLVFFAMLTSFQFRLLYRDGQLLNLRSWGYGLKTLFGPRRGYITGLLRPYLHYYRRDFHPHQHDTRDLERRWREHLAL